MSSDAEEKVKRMKHRSQTVYDDQGFIMGLVRGSILQGLGIDKDEMRTKPFIAVANSYSEFNPGHAHLKHVAEALFHRFQVRPFDHLVLAGPQEVVAELERELHDYLAQRVRARIHLPMVATPEQVLERSLAVEEEITRERDRARVAALAEAAAGDRGAVVGPEPTFEALAAGRVGELLVDVDLSLPGAACRACGRPSLEPGACPTCGDEMRPVPDVVEAAVALALRQGAHVETVNADAELADLGGIGAFLRF